MSEPDRLRARDDYPFVHYVGGDALTINRLLVLVALVISAVLAVIILLTSSEIALLTAVGWAFVVAALYLGSLLVP